MNNFKIIFAALLWWVIYFPAKADDRIYTGANAQHLVKGASIVKVNSERKSIDFVKLTPAEKIQESSAVNWLTSDILRTTQDDALRYLKTETDKSGTYHHRYEQYYKGFKVEYGVYYLHCSNGNVVSANGEWYAGIQVPEKVGVSKSVAFQNALREVPSKKYNEYLSSGMKGIMDAGELLVFPYKNKFYLAYKFDIYSLEPLKRVFIYMDAVTGKKITEVSRIHETDVPATAVTAYNGTRTMITDSIAPNSFRLKADIGFGGVRTLNLNNTTNYGGAVEFTDTDNLWNAAGMDKYAYDAHFGTQATHEYYLNEFGRNSYDNAGAQMVSYVHYSTSYVNAFWNGNYMTYGDGDGAVYTPLTSLDIVGHEITHAVTQFTAALVYSNESGALNESFSDCFGVTIDYYKNPLTANFLEGDQINVNGIPFRNMGDPNQYSHPDTYLGNFWSAAGAVHTNSGVMNHWYYLLCMGGSGTNDNGDSYSIIPIGMEDASKITYRNLTVYLTPNSTYADARFYAIQSAVDLFGSCSDQEIQVTNAWYAVGVGGIFSNAVVASFTSDVNFICTLPGTVHFTNQSSNGTSYIWDFGDGNSSSLASPSHTYTSAGNYTVKLITNGTGLCGTTDTMTKVNYISVTNGGGPQSANCSPLTSAFCCGAGITNVTFGSINNTSANASEGFKDFTCSSSTTLTAGDPVPLTVLTGTSGSENVKAWIDYNNDGQFNNLDELVMSSAGQLINHSDIVHTSLNAVLNTALRMRVIDDVAANTITDACYNPQNGQAEDYTVTFIANNAAPVVDFTADQTSIPVGSTVNFTDLTTHAPTAWQWTFTGAAITSSTIQNPSVTYNTVGIYPVTLVATNAFGTDSVTKTLYIEVVTAVNMCSGTTTLTSTSGEIYDSGGPLGGYQNNETCSLLIAPPCAQSISLSFLQFVTQTTDYLYVHDGALPTDPIILTASGSTIPANVTATSGKMLLRWVSNSATTYAGFYATFTSVIGSQNPTTAAWNASDYNPAFGSAVQFTDGSTNDPESWNWDFGDGNSSTLQNPDHSYFASGTFPVTLIVTNCVSTDTLTQNVTVQQMPNIVVDPDSISITLGCSDSITIPVYIYNTGGGELDIVISGTGNGNGIDTTVLVIQESSAWGLMMDSFLQTNFNITPDVITSAQIPTTNFSNYDVIITVGDESTTYYANINNALSQFEAFVDNGGILQHQMATQTGAAPVTIVGGAIVTRNQLQTTNNGLMMSHPLMNGISNPLTGNYANHCTISNLPPGTDVITETGTLNLPTTVEYEFGNGRVIATGMTWEHLYVNNYNPGPMLPNSINYFTSLLGSLAPWITISHNIDTISAGDTTILYVTINTTGLTAGNYHGEIVIESNDTAHNPLIIPVDLLVTGTPELAMSDSCLHFGTIGQYTSLTDSVTFTNSGCDTLDITSIIPSDPSYSVSPATGNVAPGGTQTFYVTFTPQTAGVINGWLDVYTNDNDTVICLTGASIAAPVIFTAPNPINITTAACVDSIIVPFWVYNTGGSDLNFTISGTALNTDTVRVLAMTHGADLTSEYANTISAINSSFTKYTLATSNTTDPAVLATLLNGVDVLLFPEQETGIVSHYLSMAPVVTSFANNGGTVVVLGSASGGSENRMYDMGLFTGNFLTSTNSGNITVSDTTHDYMDNVPLTFAAPNASFYHNITNIDKVELCSFNGNDIVTYRDIGSGRGVYVAFDYYGTNVSASRIISNIIKYGKLNSLPPWLQVNNTTGVIVPGDSQLVTMVVYPSQLPGGTYTTNIIIQSNDPLNPNDTLVVNLNVGFQACAAFDYNQASLCSGIVSFEDLTTNAPTSWSWDFGDGGSSTVQNPTHTYLSAGNYTVQLIACNALGCDTITNTINIASVAGPVSACAVSTTAYCCNVGITNVTLNTINNTTPNATGGYQDYSCTLSTNLIAGQSYPIQVTTGVTYAEIVRAYIDFNNDGVFSAIELVMNTAATLNHSDTVVVPANAVLNTPLRMRIGSDRSTNPLPNGCNNLLNGQYEDYTIVITPNTLPPVAAAVVDSVSLCSGFVSFTDLSTFNPTSWLWSFGDSNTSTLQNPTHTYIAPGTYTVTLIATNAFGSDTTTLSVTVNTLNATMLVTGWLQIGQQVQFTGSPSGATSYLWDFGDGFLSTLQNPTHSYAAAGSYPVSLTVTLGNCTATVVDTVVILLVGIAEADPQNSLLLLPNPYSESLTIQFYSNGREPVTLSVTDALGKVVTRFTEEQILEAGTHTYRFRHHAPGVYMVIFKSGEHTITEKVIQLK